MPSYKLTYFNVYGRGELIRLLFVLAKQPFDEVRLSFLEWLPIKHSDSNPNPFFGSLPVLDIINEDGTRIKLTQSMAIGRYLSREFNLAGYTKAEKFEVEMYMEHSDDLLRAGGAIPFIFDSEQKEKRSKKFLNTQGPALLKPFENKLESTQTGYLVGASLTAADVFFAVVIDHHFSIFRVSMLEELPLCKKLYLKVKTEPSIAMWQKSNPPKSPVELLEEVSSFNSKL